DFWNSLCCSLGILPVDLLEAFFDGLVLFFGDSSQICIILCRFTSFSGDLLSNLHHSP
ncbi:9719_t:CDS:2, partial [Racocetra persica]